MAVLRSLAQIEQVRWTPANANTFRDAVLACRAEALVAGVSRPLTDRYLFLAHVGRRASEWAEEVQPELDGGGSIPADLSELILEAARLLVSHLWGSR